MTVTQKKRHLLLAIVAICLFFPDLVFASAEGPSPTYTYDMSFDMAGLTTVSIVYDSGYASSGSSWVAVPKNLTDTDVTTLRGTISSMTRVAYRSGASGTVHPFYDNLTFSYDSSLESFSVQISFNFSYGAIIVEPNGFFYSPQIAVDPSARVAARLLLPEGVTSVNAAEPSPTRIVEIGSRTELRFNPNPESRIAVTFRVSWPKENSHIQQDMVEGDVPSRYLELGTRMVTLYKKAVPLMNDLFNKTVDRISMRFFIPLSLPQLGIGGYTPIDPSTFKTGAIYLNLFYFRAVPGMMETIAIHELTHQYEAGVGISPELLWVHEGLANYVAVQMGEPLGYDVASTDADLEAAASELNGKYAMIQNWQPEGTDSLYRYYAASYEVFKSLGDEYDGLSLYSRFFRMASKLEDGLRSSNVAVYQLGVAAGLDLFPQFAEWGFQLVDLAKIGAEIARLQTEAGWYGPLLPFREQALRHLELAESSMYSSPEAAMGHVKIAAYYIETVPMIIGTVVLVLILLIVTAFIICRRTRKKPAQSGFESTWQQTISVAAARKTLAL